MDRTCPELPAAWREVTVEQLLNHTSGVPDYAEIGGRWSRGWDDAMPPASLLALVAKDEMTFSPGSSWQYSNTGYETLRRPLTARRVLNGEARRSTDDKPEQRFTGLRRRFTERIGFVAGVLTVLDSCLISDDEACPIGAHQNPRTRWNRLRSWPGSTPRRCGGYIRLLTGTPGAVVNGASEVPQPICEAARG